MSNEQAPCDPGRPRRALRRRRPGKEQSQKPPKRAPRLVPPARNPINDLDIRLTYRTAKTLAVIGESPGRSNLEIGECAGIPDRAQMSKLLTRLARLELIENTRLPNDRGTPSAWRLTPTGIECESAITRVAFR